MDIYYDAIVIGTGIAGLFTALNIDQSQRVLLISKSQLDSGNSALAQGGIVSCKNKEVHFKDTVTAGCFYNDRDAVELIENYSHENIEKLIDYGVAFERDRLGNLKFTREGGHSEDTILYCKDTTGKEIIMCLINQALKRNNITLLEDTLVTEFILEHEQIIGISVLDSLEQMVTYYSNKVVIATGGVGMIYKNTTNSVESTGDGIALAKNVGATVIDMEFIQFHPTAMYGDDYEKRFLISEAVRGEGGILRNIYGEEFMNSYHELGDLAPRDIVARGIFEELQKTDSEFVFLDITHVDSSYVKSRFPNIYEKCLDVGVDITKDLIRVAPAEHYIMGGIKTDLDGKTSIEGLYACGECACTGVHGANRLASNSLLEGIVFGGQIAKKINKIYKTKKDQDNFKLHNNDHIIKDNNTLENSIIVKKNNGYKNKNKYQNNTNNIDNKNSNNRMMDRIQIDNLLEIEHALRDTMTRNVSIIRTETDLSRALKIIQQLEMKLSEYNTSKKLLELKNMISVSKLIVLAALNRKESIGTHFIIKQNKDEDEEGLVAR